MHGFSDPAGSADGSRKRRHRYCLPLIHEHVGTPDIAHFEAAIAGLRAPRIQRFAAPSRVANAWPGPSRFARSSM